jgi:hypothetical protein
MSKRKNKYICTEDCFSLREAMNNKLEFYKNEEYMIYESSINNLYIYNSDSKMIGSIDNNFLLLNFRPKIKHEDELRQIDSIFVKILFDE